MAANIVLNPGVGGDVSRAEDFGTCKGSVVKIHTGPVDVDGGPVTAANPLPVSDPLTTASYGTWDYKAGVSGTPTFGGGSKIRSIIARSLTGGSLTINGGDSIPIPASVGLEINPQGLLVSPTLVFTGTDMYFIEFVT